MIKNKVKQFNIQIRRRYYNNKTKQAIKDRFIAKHKVIYFVKNLNFQNQNLQSIRNLINLIQYLEPSTFIEIFKQSNIKKVFENVIQQYYQKYNLDELIKVEVSKLYCILSKSAHFLDQMELIRDEAIVVFLLDLLEKANYKDQNFYYTLECAANIMQYISNSYFFKIYDRVDLAYKITILLQHLIGKEIRWDTKSQDQFHKFLFIYSKQIYKNSYNQQYFSLINKAKIYALCQIRQLRVLDSQISQNLFGILNLVAISKQQIREIFTNHYLINNLIEQTVSILDRKIQQKQLNVILFLAKTVQDLCLSNLDFQYFEIWIGKICLYPSNKNSKLLVKIIYTILDCQIGPNQFVLVQKIKQCIIYNQFCKVLYSQNDLSYTELLKLISRTTTQSNNLVF